MKAHVYREKQGGPPTCWSSPVQVNGHRLHERMERTAIVRVGVVDYGHSVLEMVVLVVVVVVVHVDIIEIVHL